MSCRNLGIIGKIVERSQPQIVRNSDGYFVVQLVYEGDGCQDAFKINGFVGATGTFASDVVLMTNYLSIPGTVVSADAGKVKFAYNQVQSSQMKLGPERSFEMRIEDSTGVKYINFDGQLQIVAPLYVPI